MRVKGVSEGVGVVGAAGEGVVLIGLGDALADWEGGAEVATVGVDLPPRHGPRAATILAVNGAGQAIASHVSGASRPSGVAEKTVHDFHPIGVRRPLRDHLTEAHALAVAVRTTHRSPDDDTATDVPHC